MNQEELAKELSQSLFRQTYLMKMLHIEHQTFLKFKGLNSGFKNTLSFLVNAFNNGIERLKGYMPNSRKAFEQEMAMSEEKMMALSNIFSVLILLPLEDVERIEEQCNDIKKSI
jgi:hypothetical protein